MKITSKPRPRVFIGSSTEGLQIARAVQAALYYDAEPILWSQGVFGLSGGTLETLVKKSDAFDFAVFVLTADDLIRKKGKKGNAPRDNVLFELGLFMGQLGRERTFFLHCKTDRLLLPTDLAGVTAAEYLPPSEPQFLRAALSAATSPILSAILTLGLRSSSARHREGAAREFDDLRTQVAEMRVALSSFSAYAGALGKDVSSSEPKTHRIDSASDGLKFLGGTWKSQQTDTTAWCKVTGNKPRFLYCYGGDDEPTSEYYAWKRIGNTLTGKFRWFDQPVFHGYFWNEIRDQSTLEGGWWYTRDVPRHLVAKLPHVPEMVPLTWKKQGDAIPTKMRQMLQ